MSALPRWIEPQLLSLAPRVPAGAGWIHELKYDGYRLHLRLEEGRVGLLTRRGHDWAERMPSLARSAGTLAAETAYLDGELVVLDANGHPDFDALHAWIRSRRKAVPGLLAFQAFDLLHLDGEDLRTAPLIERKAELATLLAASRGASRTIRYVDHLEGNGELFFERVREAGLEGVVSKRAASRYRPGTRAGDWVKTKCFERYDLVAVGFTGALSSVLVATEDDGVLRYVGRVKGWVTRKSEAGLVAALSERETDAWPLAGRPPSVKGARWVRPELTVTVTALPRDISEPLRHATLRDWRPRNVLKLLK
jgi:bifunctional non-homologous end joining protein LigD